MDFLDPNKKRKHKVKLYTGYFLVAFAVLIGVVILLFANQGYRLDLKGNVLQNGLLFVNSHPSGADAYVEGLHNKLKANNKTDTKFELREGSYKVTIKKTGYRSWQRKINLEGGTVERLAYPFLFPEKLKSTNLKEFEGDPINISASPDRKWIIAQSPVNFLEFNVFDTSDLKKQSTSFVIPDNILSKPASNQSLELVEWASDNSSVLFKHYFDDQFEFIIINKDKPELSINVNNFSAQKPLEVALIDKKTDKLYLHMAEDGLLQQVDMKTKVLTPIAVKVLAYKGHGDDKLVYVTPHDTKPELVKVIIKDGDKSYDLKEFPAKTNYLVDIAKFDNAWYVVAGASSENAVYVFKDPITALSSESQIKNIFARTLRIENPKKVSFSANARIIAVQSGQKFAVFDAETDRQYRYSIEDRFDTDKPASWMDGHRLTTSSNNQVLVFDFDGINQQKLTAINNKTSVMFDRDYKNYFTLEPTKETSKSALSSTSLQVKE